MAKTGIYVLGIIGAIAVAFHSGGKGYGFEKHPVTSGAVPVAYADVPTVPPPSPPVGDGGGGEGGGEGEGCGGEGGCGEGDGEGDGDGA